MRETTKKSWSEGVWRGDGQKFLSQRQYNTVNVQSCVKTFLQSSMNHSQNVPLCPPKMHCDTIFQTAVSETW